MRNLYKVLSEKYLLVNEQEEKTGDVSADGESTLKINTDGTKVWRNKERELHRRGGPALEFTSGEKHWYINGIPHRLDGPAVILPDGYKQWFINGEEYSYKDWLKEIQLRKKEAQLQKKIANIHKKGSEQSGLNLGALNEQEEKEGDVTPDGESTLTIDDSGNKFWLNKFGKMHRLDGPAFVHDNGSKEWYINGKHHRLDGPAVIYTYGRKEWYVNGKRHRLDGPAIDDPNIVYRQYWIDGVQYSYNDWRKEAPFRKSLDAIHKKGSEDSGLNLGALNEKKEKTGDVSSDGESTLKMYINGNKFWRNKQGHYHRLDGPAIEWADGDKQWWINGIHYSYENWKKEVEHRKNLDTIYSKGSEVDLNLKGFNA